MTTSTWKINNYVVNLKEGEGKISVEAVDKDSKEAWGTQEITEEGASTIVEGQFDDALGTLSEMIKDAFNNSSDAKYTLSLKVCSNGGREEGVGTARRVNYSNWYTGGNHRVGHLCDLLQEDQEVPCYLEQKRGE